jgi:hypothetical protein
MTTRAATLGTTTGGAVRGFADLPELAPTTATDAVDKTDRQRFLERHAALCAQLVVSWPQFSVSCLRAAVAFAVWLSQNAADAASPESSDKASAGCVDTSSLRTNLLLCGGVTAGTMMAFHPHDPTVMAAVQASILGGFAAAQSRTSASPAPGLLALFLDVALDHSPYHVRMQFGNFGSRLSAALLAALELADGGDDLFKLPEMTKLPPALMCDRARGLCSSLSIIRLTCMWVIRDPKAMLVPDTHAAALSPATSTDRSRSRSSEVVDDPSLAASAIETVMARVCTVELPVVMRLVLKALPAAVGLGTGHTGGSAGPPDTLMEVLLKLVVILCSDARIASELRRHGLRPWLIDVARLRASEHQVRAGLWFLQRTELDMAGDVAAAIAQEFKLQPEVSLLSMLRRPAVRCALRRAPVATAFVVLQTMKPALPQSLSDSQRELVRPALTTRVEAIVAAAGGMDFRSMQRVVGVLLEMDPKELLSHLTNKHLLEEAVRAAREDLWVEDYWAREHGASSITTGRSWSGFLAWAHVCVPACTPAQWLHV